MPFVHHRCSDEITLDNDIQIEWEIYAHDYLLTCNACFVQNFVDRTWLYAPRIEGKDRILLVICGSTIEFHHKITNVNYGKVRIMLVIETGHIFSCSHWYYICIAGNHFLCVDRGMLMTVTFEKTSLRRISNMNVAHRISLEIYNRCNFLLSREMFLFWELDVFLQL